MICPVCNKNVERSYFVLKRNMCKGCDCTRRYREKYKYDLSYQEKNKKKSKKYREEHSNDPVFLERKRLSNSVYQNKNKLKVNLKAKKYRDRHKEDPIYHFTKGIRTNIARSFKRGTNSFTKGLSTEEILGCSIHDFRLYIISLFSDGMSLENYGE